MLTFQGDWHNPVSPTPVLRTLCSFPPHRGGPFGQCKPPCLRMLSRATPSAERALDAAAVSQEVIVSRFGGRLGGATVTGAQFGSEAHMCLSPG